MFATITLLDRTFPVRDRFFINNFLHIKLLPVVSYKRFKHKDDYLCHLPVPNVLPSFLCSLLAFIKGIYLYSLILLLSDIFNNYLLKTHPLCWRAATPLILL
ncbi:hypothetical protein SEEB2780_02573 [Salmonella enterica subsp. enterica serovar Bareilly str. 2780]|nr:hypothetical protein SEEB2780_02573 [Salmonella enterica subsp. enterica serovar Bareilly str. 2780]